MQQGKQRTYWLLPGQQLPAAAGDDFRELDELLANLEAQYPSACPLEDEPDRA
jgi:hypothetical protein